MGQICAYCDSVDSAKPMLLIAARSFHTIVSRFLVVLTVPWPAADAVMEPEAEAKEGDAAENEGLGLAGGEQCCHDGAELLKP